MKLISSILFLLALAPLSSYATDSNGHYAIWGKGSKSCHSYSISRNTEAEEGYKNYIMGYLTAFNVQLPDTYRISGRMNLDEILVWLDDYCELKPIIAFEQSLADFIVTHHDDRMKKSPAGYRR